MSQQQQNKPKKTYNSRRWFGFVSCVLLFIINILFNVFNLSTGTTGTWLLDASEYIWFVALGASFVAATVQLIGCSLKNNKLVAVGNILFVVQFMASVSTYWVSDGGILQNILFTAFAGMFLLFWLISIIQPNEKTVKPKDNVKINNSNQVENEIDQNFDGEKPSYIDDPTFVDPTKTDDGFKNVNPEEDVKKEANNEEIDSFATLALSDNDEKAKVKNLKDILNLNPKDIRINGLEDENKPNENDFSDKPISNKPETIEFNSIDVNELEEELNDFNEDQHRTTIDKQTKSEISKLYDDIVGNDEKYGFNNNKEFDQQPQIQQDAIFSKPQNDFRQPQPEYRPQPIKPTYQEPIKPVVKEPIKPVVKEPVKSKPQPVTQNIHNGTYIPRRLNPSDVKYVAPATKYDDIISKSSGPRKKPILNEAVLKPTKENYVLGDQDKIWKAMKGQDRDAVWKQMQLAKESNDKDKTVHEPIKLEEFSIAESIDFGSKLTFDEKETFEKELTFKPLDITFKNDLTFGPDYRARDIGEFGQKLGIDLEDMTNFTMSRRERKPKFTIPPTPKENKFELLFNDDFDEKLNKTINDQINELKGIDDATFEITSRPDNKYSETIEIFPKSEKKDPIMDTKNNFPPKDPTIDWNV